MCRKNVFKTFLFLFVSLTLIVVSFPEWAWAQRVEGTIEAAGPSSEIQAGPLPFFTAFGPLRGGYVAAGVGLRNRGFGGIPISIPAGSTVVAAFLYWDVLNPVELFAFRNVVFNGNAIVGTLIGVDRDPCWSNPQGQPAQRNFAYRANVTGLVRNGCNSLTGFFSGATDGRDAWTPQAGSNSPLPMQEGASLVIVFRNNNFPLQRIIIHNGSSTTPGGPATTTTMTIGGGGGAANPPVPARLTYIVADGQSNATKQDSAQACAGPAVTRNNALNGLDFNRRPENCAVLPNHRFLNLWDTQTINLTVPPGCNAVRATVTGLSDCLVWIAAVLSVPVDECYERFPEGDDAFSVSSATLGVDLNCTGTVDFNLTATGAFQVHRFAPQRPADGRCEIPTQITSMDLTANDPTFGGFRININRDPGSDSTGLIKQQAVGRDFPADSFFDVFAEITNDNFGRAFNCDPITMSATINNIPPVLQVYGSAGSTPFFTDPCGTPDAVPAFCLTHVGHRPERSACPPGGSTTATCLDPEFLDSDTQQSNTSLDKDK